MKLNESGFARQATMWLLARKGEGPLHAFVEAMRTDEPDALCTIMYDMKTGRCEARFVSSPRAVELEIEANPNLVDLGAAFDRYNSAAAEPYPETKEGLRDFIKNEPGRKPGLEGKASEVGQVIDRSEREAGRGEGRDGAGEGAGAVQSRAMDVRGGGERGPGSDERDRRRTGRRRDMTGEERRQKAKEKRVAAKILETDAVQIQRLACEARETGADMRDCIRGSKLIAREEGITLSGDKRLSAAFKAIEKASGDVAKELWATAKMLRDEAKTIEGGDDGAV